MKKFLFQGDSITDAFRFKEDSYSLGKGYVNIINENFKKKYPNKYLFINKGVNGNKITNLFMRTEKDIIEIAPDYLSILIGVNDVWHELEINDGVNEHDFERVYCEMIEKIKLSLPEIKIFIIEPFILHGTATEEHWDYFRNEVEKRARIAKRVANKFNAIFIPLQKYLDEEQNKSDNKEYLLKDGVHPTDIGALLIAEKLIEIFEKEL